VVFIVNILTFFVMFIILISVPEVWIELGTVLKTDLVCLV
jgi:hypothetical protein